MFLDSECTKSLHLTADKNKVNQTKGEPYQDTTETKNNQANGHAGFNNTSLTSTDSSYSTSTRPSEHNKHVSGFVLFLSLRCVLDTVLQKKTC